MVHLLSCANFGSAALQRILPFPYWCQYEKCRRAKSEYTEVRGGEQGGETRRRLRSEAAWAFPQRWRWAGALGRKCCVLYCWSRVSPSRTGEIHHTAGRTQNFHLHPKPTGMSPLQKHSVQPAYLTAKVAKGNWNILRKRNFHQDMSLPSPRAWGLLLFLLCCSHLHHTSLFC